MSTATDEADRLVDEAFEDKGSARVALERVNELAADPANEADLAHLQDDALVLSRLVPVQ